MAPDHDEHLRVERVLVTHTTGHEQPDDEEVGIQTVFRALVEDEERSGRSAVTSLQPLRPGGTVSCSRSGRSTSKRSRGNSNVSGSKRS